MFTVDGNQWNVLTRIAPQPVCTCGYMNNFVAHLDLYETDIVISALFRLLVITYTTC